jgi:hypothetical protein
VVKKPLIGLETIFTGLARLKKGKSAKSIHSFQFEIPKKMLDFLFLKMSTKERVGKRMNKRCYLKMFR